MLVLLLCTGVGFGIVSARERPRKEALFSYALLPTLSFDVIVRFQLFLLQFKVYEFLHTIKLINYNIISKKIFHLAIHLINILGFPNHHIDMVITLRRIELKLQ